jgi:hypothetical protein
MKKKIIEITNLEEIADRIQEVLIEEEEAQMMEKKPLGTISPSLKQKFINWRNENEDFRAEVNFKREQLEKRGERELEELYRHRFEALQERKKTIWESIREEVKAPEDSDLNIEPYTGVISQWVKSDENLGD